MGEESKKVLKPFPVSSRRLKQKRKAIRSLWCDRISVEENVPKKDEISGLTTFEREPVLKDEPCRIVSQTIDSATTGEPAKAYKTINVMLDEMVDIKAGSFIRVTNVTGHVYEGKRTGAPLRKSDSQTIVVEVEKEYA